MRTVGELSGSCMGAVWELSGDCLGAVSGGRVGELSGSCTVGSVSCLGVVWVCVLLHVRLCYGPSSQKLLRLVEDANIDLNMLNVSKNCFKNLKTC